MREGAHRSAQAGAESVARQVAEPFTNDTFEFVVARLDIEAEAMIAAASLLSDEERQRANRFVFDRDRDRFVVARAHLRKLLGARLGVQPEVVKFTYGPHGKPELAQEFSREELRFNISHSEDVAVYAFSHGREIGVDVEAVRTLPDFDEVAAYCFSSFENEAHQNLDEQNKPQGFFNCWTRKEAFIKALGEGLYHPLDNFDVTLAPGEVTKILRVGNVAGDICGWELYSFCPMPGYVGAVVVESRV